MSRESFRRDISREFDAISGSPSPALSARVRSALAQDRPAPQTGPFWMAGIAAAVIAAIVVGLLVFASFNRNQSNAGPPRLTTPSPTAVASPTPNVTPSPAQTPPDSTLPAFVCGSSSLAGASAPTVAFVDAVRTGTHPGYDRITIEFQNGEAATVEVQPQGSANFTLGASGQPVTLKGTAGLLVTIRGADEHTAYSGSTDFNTGYPVLVEARQVQDFEGAVQWGLGLSKSACYRAFWLTNPARLVIDVQNS